MFVIWSFQDDSYSEVNKEKRLAILETFQPACGMVQPSCFAKIKNVLELGHYELGNCEAVMFVCHNCTKVLAVMVVVNQKQLELTDKFIWQISL